MPSTQKRVRDIQRLLNRQKTIAAATVSTRVAGGDKDGTSDGGDRISNAREEHRVMEKTRTLEEQLAQALEHRQQSKLSETQRKHAVKYHMVRFLERKKLTKLIRQSEQQQRDGQENASLNKRIEKLKEDLAYVLYYPMEFKYIALLRGSSDDTTADVAATATDNDNDVNDTVQGSSSQLKRQQAARTLALQRWAADFGSGDDKVVHAMEVEYQSSSSSNNNNSKRNSSSNNNNSKRNSSSSNNNNNNNNNSGGDNKKRKAATFNTQDESDAEDPLLVADRVDALPKKSQQKFPSAAATAAAAAATGAENRREKKSKSDAVATATEISSNSNSNKAEVGISSSGNDIGSGGGRGTKGAANVTAAAAAHQISSFGLAADSFFLEEAPAAGSGTNQKDADDAAAIASFNASGSGSGSGDARRSGGRGGAMRSGFTDVQAAVNRRKFQKHKRIFHNKTLREKFSNNK